MKKIISLFLFISLLICGIIFDLAPINVSEGIDKVYHFIGFSLLTTTAILMFISFFGKKIINSLLMFLMLFGGIGAGISEALQQFVGRSCDVNDWLVNLCGITFVVIVAYLNNSKENSVKDSQQSRFDFKDLPVLS